MRHDADYEIDFYAWTQDQADRLRSAGLRRVNVDIDWENVAEEVESLGRSQFRTARNHLVRIIEHLLKLEHSSAPQPRRAWKKSVETHRRDAAQEIEDSPSLVAKIAENLSRSFADAREDAAYGLEEDGVDKSELPETCPYSLDEVLERGWFPKNRHGLE